MDWFEYFGENSRGRRQPIRVASDLVVLALPFEHKIFPMFWVHWYGIIWIFEIYGCHKASWLYEFERHLKGIHLKVVLIHKLIEWL